MSAPSSPPSKPQKPELFLAPPSQQQQQQQQQQSQRGGAGPLSPTTGAAGAGAGTARSGSTSSDTRTVSQPGTPQINKISTKLTDLLRATALELESKHSETLTLDETIALQNFERVVQNRKKGSDEWGNEQVVSMWNKANELKDKEGRGSFGELFYQDFFSSSEQLQDAFFTSTDLRVQSNLLVNMMSKAIQFVNKPAQLAQLLEHVGAKHAMYGAEPHHFELVSTCFARSLKLALGDEFDEAMLTQWNRVFNSIAAEMIRAAQSEGALQWKRRATKQRLEVFSGLVKKSLERSFNNDILAFCKAWLDEAVATSTNRRIPTAPPEIVQQKCARAASALSVLMSSKLRTAAQYNDLSQLATAAIKAAPHVLIWMRTVMDAEQTDRQELHVVVSALKSLILRSVGDSEPISKLNMTIISLFINYFYESMKSQIIELQVAAPFAPLTVPFALLITDIEGSSTLFNHHRNAMSLALKQHFQQVKRAMQQYKCHEVRVKTIGDSFMIAGADMQRILGLALELQRAQNALPVVAELASAAATKEESEEGQQQQKQQNDANNNNNKHSRGTGASFKQGQLRVKCMIHWCHNVLPVGTSTGNDVFDYVGPDVNVPVRMLGLGYGGQIVMTDQASARLEMERPDLPFPDALGVGAATVMAMSNTLSKSGGAQQENNNSSNKSDGAAAASSSSSTTTTTTTVTTPEKSPQANPLSSMRASAEIAPPSPSLVCTGTERVDEVKPHEYPLIDKDTVVFSARITGTVLKGAQRALTLRTCCPKEFADREFPPFKSDDRSASGSEADHK